MAEHAPGFRNNPSYRVEIEPSPRRVRVMFAGEIVADSRRPFLLRETGHTPVYYFPRDDVRLDLCTPTDHRTHCPFKGHASYWNLTAGGRTAENAVWAYDEPYLEVPGLRGICAFYWSRVDHWYEEDEEIFVHPRDPYKRVDVLLSHRPVEVVVAGETVARTSDAHFLFETGLPTRYYVPPDDVRMDLLVPSDKVTRCPYKGTARYWHARVGETVIEDVAWSYPEANPEAAKIAGQICFFDELVDEVRVEGVAQTRPETKWSRKT